MNSLIEKKCKPCEGKVRPFSATEAEKYLLQTPGWTLDQEHNLISREWIAKNFMEAIEFIRRVAGVAESENHHPDIHLTGYRNVRIELTTHAIKGLSENDFIVAAKINELKPEVKA